MVMSDPRADHVGFTGTRLGMTNARCARIGCGSALICCNPDCPIVTVDVEPGVRRIYSREEFVAAVRNEAVRLGIDVAAIERRARKSVDDMLGSDRIPEREG